MTVYLSRLPAPPTAPSAADHAYRGRGAGLPFPTRRPVISANRATNVSSPNGAPVRSR